MRMGGPHVLPAVIQPLHRGGPNGTVYVTDYTDGTMYAVTIGSPNV